MLPVDLVKFCLRRSNVAVVETILTGSALKMSWEGAQEIPFLLCYCHENTEHPFSAPRIQDNS